MDKTEHQPKVSVIVAVYGAERWIERCVDSLLAQTLDDFEIILVDDGSKDRSGEICDRYAAADNRVRVIHQANGGVSRARQTGVDAARGEYTIHCDPDDWTEPEMLASLYAKAKEDDADMVICDYYTENRWVTRRQCQDPGKDLSPMAVCALLFQRLHGSLCNKLVKNELVTKNKIRFEPEEITFCEDQLFVCRILLVADKISYLDKSFYHYVDNGSSLCKTIYKREKSNQLLLLLFKELLPFPESYYNETKRQILTNAFVNRQYQKMQTMYPEVNADIIESGRRYRWYAPISSCLSLALRGYPRTARLLYSLNMTAISVMQYLKYHLLKHKQ